MIGRYRAGLMTGPFTSRELRTYWASTVGERRQGRRNQTTWGTSLQKPKPGLWMEKRAWQRLF